MHEQAYRALQTAAERMGANNYRAGLREHVKAGRKPRTFRYTPTAEHAAIVAALPKVLAGTMTPDEALAMLHEYETEKQRLA